MAAWWLRVDGGGYLPGLPSREGVAYVSGPAVGEHACKTLYLDRRLARNREPLRMKIKRRVGRYRRLEKRIAATVPSPCAQFPIEQSCLWYAAVRAD